MTPTRPTTTTTHRKGTETMTTTTTPTYCPCTGTVRTYDSRDGYRYIECIDCGHDITEPDDVYADRVNARPLHHPDGTPADVVAHDRAETEPCQKGTVGCAVDHRGLGHRRQGEAMPCETW